MADRLRISRRTLAIFLLASVAAHALLLVYVPGWRVSLPAPAPEMPMLDVVMVAPQPPVAALPPQAAAPAVRSPTPPAPRKAVPPLAPEPAIPPVPRTAEPAGAAASAAASPPLSEAASPSLPAVEPAPPAAARSPAPPASPAAQAPPPLITPPAFSAAYLRNPPPAYPALARRNGEEGTVLLRVLVGRDGTPLKVEIDQSSRSRLLDHAALDAVKGWRFVPARRGTDAIEAWVRVPVSFRLES